MRAAGGVVVSVVDGSGERSMLTDRGPSPQLRADEIDVGWLRDCDVLHVSGLRDARRPDRPGGCDGRPGAARAQGARISVDLASARGIADFGADRCSHGSSELAAGRRVRRRTRARSPWREPPGRHARRQVRARAALPSSETGAGRSTPPWPADVVDPTGAGDALAAGFLVGGHRARPGGGSSLRLAGGSDAVTSHVVSRTRPRSRMP